MIRITKDNTLPDSGLHIWWIGVWRWYTKVTVMRRCDVIVHTLSGIEIGPFEFTYKHREPE